MIKIDSGLLEEMSDKSRIADRKRVHYIFHKSHGDPLQRMLNAMQPGSYLQPHKHEEPDKSEILLVLAGKFIVVEFENNGTIRDHFIIHANSRNSAVEISARVFHTVICLEADSVLYEIKEGPFNPIDDKDFAKWAPKEGSPECEHYLKKILDNLSIQISE